MTHVQAIGPARALRAPRGGEATEAAESGDEEAAKEAPAAGAKSALGRRLAECRFVTCVEIVPPRGHDPASAVESARLLERRGVDCVNIPDGPRACARMSPMSLASILAAATRLEIVLHCNCRDRNLLGMQSDLLGLSAQNIRNLLLITGDPPGLGDCPEATPVYDVDSVGLTRVVSSLNRGVDIGGRRMDAPTSFFIGVGVNPGADRLDREVERLEAKVAAGAEFAVTQPVFDIGVLERFLKRIRHLGLPVLAGIWPLRSLRNAEFLKN